MTDLPAPNILLLVQRLTLAYLDYDIDSISTVIAEIEDAGVDVWKIMALCACSEYATEVSERQGDQATEWLLRRIEHIVDHHP